MDARRQAWLAAHPVLEPIARFEAAVEHAAAAVAPRAVRAPPWEAWACDRAAGVPLLRSAAAGPALAAAAADALGQLAARLDASALPSGLAGAWGELREPLASPKERERAIAWIVAGAPAESAPSQAGLLRHVAWSAMRRVLAAALEGAGDWCGEERWGQPRCPACGALPALALLVPGDARPRHLACALCGTRWRWRRIGCPFCEAEAQDRSAILHVEGEEAVRLDVCGACNGYLKTCTDEGDEALLLADWPTLHLDVAASERGLRRAGASLYDLPQEERRTEPCPTRC